MKKRILFNIYLFITITLITTCISAPNYADLGKPADLVPFSSKVLTGYLPNGLKYYIMENSLPENRAHMGLVVNAGSVLERDDQRGFAHFIEHLAFSDTARFPDLQIQEYLRSLGMRFGPDFNANTSHERTLYYFDIPVENIDGVKRIPEKGLAILDDWTHQVSFKQEFVDSERRVILEEMRARSGASERIRKITFPLLFAGSPYEDRDVIGIEETIINSTQGTLKEFYDFWYTSDNMAIIFIGDFDGKELEAELANHFNMPHFIQKSPRPVYNLPPPQKGNLSVEIITDPEITSVDFTVYYKQKHSAKKGTLEFYRETVIDYLISQMLNMRFEEASLDPESASLKSRGVPWYWAERSKFFVMSAQAKTGMAHKALIELFNEIEYLRRGWGFTESELRRAKLNLISYMEKQVSEKDRRESRSFLRGFVSNFLYGEDFADIEWELEAVKALLPLINAKEISNEAKKYFQEDDAIIIVTSPEKEKENLPSIQEIKNIYNISRRFLLFKRQEDAFLGYLLDEIPAYVSCQDEFKDEETDSYILVLPNGARVILKETNNRNNEISFYAMAKGGIMNVPDESSVSGEFLSEMIQVSGLGKYSRTDLINILAGKQVSFSFWTANYYRGFQGSAVTADIITLFEMINLFFTSPRLDERAIKAMLDQYKTNLMHELEDPQTVFFNEVTRIVTSNHPRFKPLELSDIDKISIQEAKEFLFKCLNPADYTFIFTGNINLEAMREYASQYIGSIPNQNKERMNSFSNPGIIRPFNISHIINKGKDERSMVYLSWYSAADNQFNERRSQASAVLNEYLNILLNDEIRERLGGVYGISSGSGASVIPRGENSLYVYFVCNPQRAEELINAVIASLQNMANTTLNPDTFNKAKEALIMQHQRSMQRNLHIAQSYANSFVLYDTPLSRLNNRPDVIREVAMNEVQILLRQILSLGPIQIVMYPEEKN